MFAVKNSTNRNEARSPAAEMIGGKLPNPQVAQFLPFSADDLTAHGFTE